MAQVEGWESDDITELESFLLNDVRHRHWSARLVSGHLPGRSEQLAGDDLQAQPVLLVVSLIGVIIPTKSLDKALYCRGCLQ